MYSYHLFHFINSKINFKTRNNNKISILYFYSTFTQNIFHCDEYLASDSGDINLRLYSNDGSPTRGPPGCITRPAPTFFNYVYATKITH